MSVLLLLATADVVVVPVSPPPSRGQLGLRCYLVGARKRCEKLSSEMLRSDVGLSSFVR